MHAFRETIRACRYAIVVSIAVVSLKLWSFGVMKRCYNVVLGDDPKKNCTEKKPDLIPEYATRTPYTTYERKFKTPGV
ncbi:hypothetical protein AAVH_07037 [Aphelenchoides avenae]|nr:hypothetical protein AAVH_07037 [Aphelenchus avenae]